MNYYSTKTYGHELGLSCVFRQALAKSHCKQLHGYALSFKFTFGADKLTSEGWVVDFGGLDRLKNELKSMYDHKMLISKHDTKLLKDRVYLNKYADIRIVEGVGCEAFAQQAYNLASEVLRIDFPNAYVVSCEVSEHGGNSAVYSPGVTL